MYNTQKTELSEIYKKISNCASFAIYGAQVVAYGAYIALKSLCNITPKCFIVSRSDGNPMEIDVVSVRTLDSCALSNDTLIIVAVTELLQNEICFALRERGYNNVIRFDAHTEHILMSAYFDRIDKFPQLRRAATAEPPIDLRVYECHGPKDKKLANPPLLKSWESKFIAGITDADRENIAGKNHMYSEMTAAYWLWKNAKHDYKGIAHYRRHLELADEQIRELSKGETDAVLPLPYICYPDTISQFRRFVSEDVVNMLLTSLKALYTKKYDEHLKILRGKYQYTYNLVIAKDDVYNEYCNWVFGILEHMELSLDRIHEIANTRALSYVSEVLTNLYFMSNADRLTIRHVEKRIYI